MKACGSTVPARFAARLVLVPRARRALCAGTPSHEGVIRTGGVRSLCGQLSASAVRLHWRLCGTDFDDPQPVTCPRCVLTGKVCAHCGQPITRRQSYMSLSGGRWQHLRACW